MTIARRIVSLSLCLATPLVLGGCDEHGQPDAVARVTPVSQVKSEAVKSEAAPAAEAAKPQASAAAPKNQAPKNETQKPENQQADPKPATDEGEVPADFSTKTQDPHAGHNHRPTPPMPGKIIDPASYIVKAEPAEVNLGELPTQDSKVGTVTLVNTGDSPMTVISAKASCGCTTLKLTPNTVIEPKGKLDVEVKLNAPPKAGAVNKNVTFDIEGQPALVVPVKAVAISYVVMEPNQLEPNAQPEGKFKLKSVDNQPFRIISAQPAVLGEFAKEPKVEHELQMDFAKYREIGIARQATVYLDHPKCPQVMVTVNFDPKEIAEAAAKRRQEAQKNGQAIRPQTPAQPAPAADPDTILANLVKEKKTSEVLQRIASGLDVNYRDNSGMPLLALAAKHGNVELVQALLAAKDVQLEAADNAGRTPLMHASTAKNVEVVRALLDAGANISARDTIGGTALSWAAGLGDPDSVKELIDRGADVEVVGSVTGWTPLIWAAGFGEFGSIEPLLDANANIEVADYLQGATPLIHAARTGRMESMLTLIKRGADIENADKNGQTPLLACAATSGGTAAKIQALIDAGANVDAKDNRGLNALDLANKRTDPRAAEVVALLEKHLSKTEAPAQQPKATQGQ